MPNEIDISINGESHAIEADGQSNEITSDYGDNQELTTIVSATIADKPVVEPPPPIEPPQGEILPDTPLNHWHTHQDSLASIIEPLPQPEHLAERLPSGLLSYSTAVEVEYSGEHNNFTPEPAIAIPGGGHNDQYENAIPCYLLVTRKWIILPNTRSNPLDMKDCGKTRQDGSGGDESWEYSDGRRPSCHTYDSAAYDRATKLLFLCGRTAVYNNSGSDMAIDAYSMETLDFVDTGLRRLQGGKNTWSGTCTNVGGFIHLHAGGSSGSGSRPETIDCANLTNKIHGSTPFPLKRGDRYVTRHSTKTNYLYHFGNQYNSATGKREIHVLRYLKPEYSDNSNIEPENVSHLFTGDLSGIEESRPNAKPYAYSVAWVEDLDLFFIRTYDNGGQLKYFSELDYEIKTWGVHPDSPIPAEDTVKSAGGINGRFGYCSARGTLYDINHADHGVSEFKLIRKGAPEQQDDEPNPEPPADDKPEPPNNDQPVDQIGIPPEDETPPPPPVDDSNLTPVTFGWLFAPDEPDRALMIDGKVYDTQIDNITTLPNGYQHCRVTAMVPRTVDTLRPEFSGEASAQPSELARKPFISVSFEQGDRHQEISIHHGDANAGSIREVSEGQSWLTEAPNIRFKVLGEQYVGAYRGKVIISNEEAYLDDPKGVHFDCIKVFVNGEEMEKVTDVWLAHGQHFMFRVGGDGIKDIFVQHDTKRLAKSGLIPNLRDDLHRTQEPLVEQYILDELKNREIEYIRKPNTKKGLPEGRYTYDKWGAGGIGVMPQFMGTAGSQAHIGHCTRWVAWHLLNPSRLTMGFMLAMADCSGSFPVGYCEDGKLIDFATHPYATLQQNTPAVNPDTGMDERVKRTTGDLREETTCAYSADTAHQPDLCFIPWLLTADEYYQEQVKRWGNYVLLYKTPKNRGFSDGLCNNHKNFGNPDREGSIEAPRGFAWGLRNVFYSYIATSDDDPEKSMRENWMSRNFTWLIQKYKNSPPNDFGMLTSQLGQTRSSPWMNHFFAIVIAGIARAGTEGHREVARLFCKFAVKQVKELPFEQCNPSRFHCRTSDGVFFRDLREMYDYSVQTESQAEDSETMVDGEGQELLDNLSAMYGRTVTEGELMGFPSNPESYTQIMECALACAVDLGVENAQEAYDKVRNRTNAIPLSGSKNSLAFAPQFCWEPAK